MPNGLKIEHSRDILKAARQDSMHRVLQRFLPRLFFTLVIVGVLDLALFLAGAFYLGGDAVNGKIEAGRYYVWGYRHGAKGYVEVSHGAFYYSKWHAYSVMVTWPLMILAGVMYERIRRRPED
jgi:hypothetical protein